MSSAGRPEGGDGAHGPARVDDGLAAAVVITPDMLAPPAGRDGTPATRVDFERGMRYAPPLTLVLLLANLVAFGWQLATGALDSQGTIVDAGALVRARVMAGELWRLGSAVFLHGSAEHLLSNVVSLYIVGMACEHALGALGLAAVYVVSALSGSLVSMATGPGPSVGASGAIFGVVGAVIVTLHRHRERFHLRDGRIGIVLVAWAGYTFVLGAASPMVDNGAHLGGLIGGALAAVLVPLRPSLATAPGAPTLS